MKLKYKVGDLVKIKSKEYLLHFLKQTFDLDNYNYNEKLNLVRCEEHCGKILAIDAIEKDGLNPETCPSFKYGIYFSEGTAYYPENCFEDLKEKLDKLLK